MAVLFLTFLFTELERSRVRGAFAQYLSPEMVNRLAESSESLVLGGERKEMTFCSQILEVLPKYLNNTRTIQKP